MIIFAGAVAAGATGAFFSDTETSTGNTFTAGSIDLQIDNESFRNGIASESTSWLSPVDLTVEKFFNFIDLKPADYGEDTISIHTGDNESWICADVSLTSDDDVSCTESESGDDPTCGEPDADNADGDLADGINFLWWADDGDNVLEQDEPVLPGGPLGAISVGSTSTVPLTDSANNIFGGIGTPFPGNATEHVGKAWCFGAINALPLSPSAYTGPDANNNGDGLIGSPEDGGFTCNGTAVNNAAQTDSLTANVAFRAVQSQNNPDFVCVP